MSKDIEIREINNDIEFFEQFLEKQKNLFQINVLINMEKEKSTKLPPNLNQEVLS